MTERVLPRDTILGDLQLSEVYGQYEGPYLLSCMNGAGHMFIALATDRGPEADEWLYVPISKTRLEFVRTGGIALRTAFSQSESGMAYVVQVPHDQSAAVVSGLKNADIPEDYYPSTDVRLALMPSPVEHHALASELARQINRDVVDIDLEFAEHVRPEAPARAVGELLQEFQGFARTYGELLLRKILKAGQTLLPENLRHHTDFLVVPFSFGSFSIRLYGSYERDMFQDATTKQIVNQFVSLMDLASQNAETLAEGLRTISGPPAKHFEKFLESAAFDGELLLDWGQPDIEQIYRTGISAAKAKAVVASVREIQLGEACEIEVPCLLKAVHSRLKTFEIEDIGSGNRYQGKIDNAAMESATHATINKNYQATLRESSEGTPSTGVSKKYSLLSLESPAEDHAQ